jgi:hypothetical protein
MTDTAIAAPEPTALDEARLRELQILSEDLHLCLSEVGSGNVAEPPSRRDGLPEDVPGVSVLVS